MASHRITETELFKLLRKQEEKDGFEAAEVSSRVSAVAGEVWPLLQQVSRAFPLYTLHDPEHSFRVAEHMANLIPRRTLSQLNSVEISVLLYAAYLHDMGMSASQDQLYSWLKSNEYEAFIAAHENWESAINAQNNEEGDSTEKAAPSNNSASLTLRQLQDAAYTDYLREKHPQRGAELIIARFGSKGTSDNKIQLQEANYADYVALVCKSHGEPATVLKGTDFRRDAHIGKFSVNLQYCAAILRLADLADLDPERTPKVLFDFIMLDLCPPDSRDGAVPAARAKSAEEWAKHRAVLGYKITPEEIRIEAKCTHPAIQRGLNEWCDYLDYERRDCRLIVQDNRKEIAEKYALGLASDVRKDFILSDGSYIYADFQFQLDYDRIVSLLMGTELWGDPAVVFRELLQNALDACHHRKALSARLGLPYTPKIRFSTSHEWNRVKDEAAIICEDNGAGMDQHIVENFLMRIGRSYYHSPEFRQQNLDFRPIGQFGLGVMSYFMLADSLDIRTQRFEADGTKKPALIVEVNSAGRYVILRQGKDNRDGTSVKLAVNIRSRKHRWREHKFRDDFDHPLMLLDCAEGVLRELAIHVEVPLEIAHRGHESTIIQPQPFSIPAYDPSAIPCMRGHYREFIFHYDYEQTDGLAGTFRFLIPLDERGNLCLVAPVESLFKIFTDPDGELCLTHPGYKDDDKTIDLAVSLSGDWDDDELRGVYRHKFGQKPLKKESYGGHEPLEIIEPYFRWSQNGLLVGQLKFEGRGFRHRRPQHDDDDDDEAKPADLFKHIPVPGLNAADIDLRGVWQVPLNVQRTDFRQGPAFTAFVERYYALASQMWKDILKQAGLLDDLDAHRRFIDSLLKRADWHLETQLKKAIGYEERKAESK